MYASSCCACEVHCRRAEQERNGGFGFVGGVTGDFGNATGVTDSPVFGKHRYLFSTYDEALHLAAFSVSSYCVSPKLVWFVSLADEGDVLCPVCRRSRCVMSCFAGGLDVSFPVFADARDVLRALGRRGGIEISGVSVEAASLVVPSS